MCSHTVAPSLSSAFSTDADRDSDRGLLWRSMSIVISIPRRILGILPIRDHRIFPCPNSSGGMGRNCGIV
uniref:Uncharacterized protein n=1 Tax=Phlebotomus papatasi TaxID=29031 RepID=A0A1B0D7K0_PHLPP